MKIIFAGDYESQNSISWCNGLIMVDENVSITYFKLSKKILGINIPYFISLFLGYFQLKWKIITRKPDLIIGYRTTSYGFLVSLLNFKPFVIACQGETDLFGAQGCVKRLKSFCKKYACKRAQMIHAWGENMVPSLIEHKCNPENILVMPRGIKIENFKFKESKAPLNDEIGILSTRSLFPEYNIDKVIDFIKNDSRLKLHIIGSGSEENMLKEIVRINNLELRVFFYGRLPNSKISEIAQKCKFYVSIPKTEGMSTSLFESFCMGLLPILNDISANTFWVKNKENGSIIKNLSEKEFMDAISFWSSDVNDFLLNNAIGKNRITAETKLNIDTNMRFFLKEYKRLISESNN